MLLPIGSLHPHFPISHPHEELSADPSALVLASLPDGTRQKWAGSTVAGVLTILAGTAFALSNLTDSESRAAGGGLRYS
jgi:hypothetical protein